MNLKEMLEGTAREVPQKTAIVLDSHRVTYGELEETSNRVANALIELGVERNDRVAILMSHSPGWVINYFGVIKAGGVAVLLSSMLKAPELDSFLRDSDTEILITEKSFLPILPTSLPAAVKQVLEVDGNHYQMMLARSSAISPDIDIKDDDEATVMCVAGVLGKQRGVVHTHASLTGPLSIISTGIGRSREDVVVDPIPFFYLLGLGEVLLGSIKEGSTIVIVPHFSPREVLEVIERERGSILFGVPAIYNTLAMVRDEVIKNYDISSLRVASSAGAKSSPDLMKMLEDKFNLVFCETYGLSESFVVSMSTLDNHKLGAVGKPICSLKIVDDDGNEVTQGEIGEAVFKVPWIVKGYYKAPDLTAQVIRNGWFHTGDLVRMDENGYLEYVEKKSFVIVTPKGLKISPWEVEDVLLRYPAVSAAACVGVKNGRVDEIPTAFIVLKEGQNVTVEELASFCQQNLANFKQPEQIKFVDSIPKTGSGEIDRRWLKEKG
ncbi:MAG: AMP-binding protein [Chloroflexota bacterium]|nr:AMP-binding protein [Chloroflexota bacterium]